MGRCWKPRWSCRGWSRRGIVAGIDEIVRPVRFPGWQHTSGGEREVKRALRKALCKYDLHQREDLFDRANAYIAEYY